MRLYEDIAQWGRIDTTYDYPVGERPSRVMSPRPSRPFDNPKMDRMPRCSSLAPGAKRLYAVPLHNGQSLDFADHPLPIEPQPHTA